MADEKTVSEQGNIRRKAGHGWLFWLFLALPIAAVVVVLTLVGTTITNSSIQEFLASPEFQRTLSDRAPWVAYCFGNLGIFCVECICAALLASRRIRLGRRGLLAIAVTGTVCGVLLHAMVYGVNIFIPAPYTLLTPEHISIRIFNWGNITTPFVELGVPAAMIAGVIIHLFAPQVLLGLGIAVVAVRRLRS